MPPGLSAGTMIVSLLPANRTVGSNRRQGSSEEPGRSRALRTATQTRNEAVSPARFPRRWNLHDHIGRLDHADRLVAERQAQLVDCLRGHQADHPMRTREDLN